MLKEFRRIALGVLLFPLLSSAPTALCAQTPPPPPAPVLTGLSPDRLSIGEVVTLSGEHFRVSDNPVTVTFAPGLRVSAAPSADSKVRVTVPQGAQTGPVTLTTTCNHEGRPLVQTSAPGNVLVLWDSMPFSALGLASNARAWTLVPGQEDDFYGWFYRQSGSWNFQDLIHIRGDGTSQNLFQNASPTSGCGRLARYPTRNPVTGGWVALWSQGCSPGALYTVGGLTDGTVLWQEPYVNGRWAVCGLGHDGAGNLHVLGGRWQDYAHQYLCVWRFAPGDPVVLDPSNPSTALTPGGLQTYFYQNQMNVGPDGTVLLLVQVVDNRHTEMWRLTPGVAAVERFPEPPCDHQSYGWWHRTLDCRGRGYSFNPYQWHWSGESATTVYSAPEGAPLGTLAPGGAFRDGLVSDGYANLYLWERDASYANRFRRVKPAELPDGYYDGFDCCPVPDRQPILGEANEPPGVPIPPSVCDVGGKLVVKLFPRPEDPISGMPGDGMFTWIDGDAQNPAAAQVLFGQAPELKAYWEASPGAPPTPETVKWEVVAGSETAPNADPKGLYPSKPEVLFTGGANPYESNTLRFQTVHTGSFVLRATTKDTNHKGPDGQPAKIELAFTVAAPAGLMDYSSPHHEYDSLIIQHADKYGIPPQYIKSQAYEESGHDYDPNAYRYEPLGFDKKYISKWSSSDWAENSYDYFRFPGGPGLSEADRVQREKFRHIVYYDFTIQPPVLPYTCEPYDRNAPDVFLYDVVIANDGWPSGSYPWTLYNYARGPCGAIPQNWSGNAGGQLTWHDETFYCGATATSPCSAGQRRLIQWLYGHWEYPAQTAVASSYGLLQLMYPTAVGQMGWRKGQAPPNRDPVLLFDPATSLDLGTGYDAHNTLRGPFARDSNHEWPTLFDYQQALVSGFREYNPKRWEYKIGLHIWQGFIFTPY